MKGKTTSQQQQQNTYDYKAPPVTPQQQNLDTSISKAYDTSDPTIPYTFAHSREAQHDSFANPFGANVSPEVQDAINRSGDENSYQEEGLALRQDAAQRAQAKVGASATSAGLVAPQLVQTGGSSTGSGTQSQPWGPALIGAVGGVGSAALT